MVVMSIFENEEHKAASEILSEFFPLICSAARSPSMNPKKVADEMSEKLGDGYQVHWREAQATYVNPAPEPRPIVTVVGDGYEMSLDVLGPGPITVLGKDFGVIEGFPTFEKWKSSMNTPTEPGWYWVRKSNDELTTDTPWRVEHVLDVQTPADPSFDSDVAEGGVPIHIEWGPKIPDPEKLSRMTDIYERYVRGVNAAAMAGGIPPSLNYIPPGSF